MSNMVLRNVVILTVDTPNKNNRIYSTEMVQKMLDNLVQPVFGAFSPYGMPKALDCDLSLASHRINNLRLKDNKLLGDVHIMNTPAGHLLSTRMSIRPDLDFRMAGIGNVSSIGHVHDYDLYGIHAVLDGA